MTLPLDAADAIIAQLLDPHCTLRRCDVACELRRVRMLLAEVREEMDAASRPGTARERGMRVAGGVA